MANKKIVVCWNCSEYNKYIKKELDSQKGITSIICTNLQELKKALKGDGISGIVVLCELQWSFDEPETQKNTKQYTDMYGIDLVEKYIRTKLKNKKPVLFVSFLSRKQIIEECNSDFDKRIISTPALKHEFADILQPIDDWLKKLDSLEDMTELELEYTVWNFCSLDGLVSQIKHLIGSCSTEKAIKEVVLRTMKPLVRIMNDELKNRYNEIVKTIENANIIQMQEEINGICSQLEKQGHIKL